MEEDKQQWLSIAAVVLVIGGLGYFLFRQSQQSEEPVIETADEVASERADELIDQMNFEIPEDAERVNLRDVSGSSGAGVATRMGEEGEMELSILAALPEIEEGEKYEAYLVGEGDENEIYLGELRQAKGGWMLEYQSSSDVSGYNAVKVTHEKVDDKTSEETVLEGSF